MPLPISDERLGETGQIQALLTTLDANTAQFGPDHPETLAVVNQVAVAFWCAGDIDRAIGLLDRCLDRVTCSLGDEHPLRVEVLSILGGIMFEQRHLDQAVMIHREVLECRVRHAGANHPSSLAAKGDLASVLFEQGLDDEACWLEQEAFETARAHLGRTHPVRCVLAWNRALSYERCGDMDSARRVVVGELVWLLAEDSSRLAADQDAIRTLLSKRLKWDASNVC